MRKAVILTLMVLLVLGSAFAKDNLAILPFSGGQGDEGDTIAELFSFDPRLKEAFTPIPRTRITSAMDRERGFQMRSGLTDVDTIAKIGQGLGAQYVMAGNITTLGRSKLLVISILKMDTLQQIAGDVLTYTRIEEIREKLPRMVENVLAAARNSTDAADKLAVVPVALQSGTDEQVADTLAQILAIHLIRSGVYSVYPRTKSLEQVQDEYANQRNQAAEKYMTDLGHGENPYLVLSVAARTLGSVNMFNAVIIDLVTNAQVIGKSVEYSGIEDGMRAMESLARELTGKGGGNRPAEPFPRSGFSTGRKVGTGFLNLAFGAGSFTMGDWGGGLTLAAGHAVGWTLFIVDIAALKYEDAAAGVLAPIGLGVIGISAVYGFIRPFIYHPKGKGNALVDVLDRVHVAIIPDVTGIKAVGLSYTYHY